MNTPLIESSHHILMCLSPVSRMDVLQPQYALTRGSARGSIRSITCTHGRRKDQSHTIVIVYSCLREFMVLSKMTTIPPPSTVSTVLASRLGVIASKSCEGE